MISWLIDRTEISPLEGPVIPSSIQKNDGIISCWSSVVGSLQNPLTLALPREHSLIPGAERLAAALRIVAAGLLPQPSLAQKLRPQFPDRGRLFDLDVAENAKAP